MPLIFMHTVGDYIYLTSGTAGPFVAEALDIRIHLVIAFTNMAVELYLMTGATDEALSGHGQPAQDAA